MSSISQKIHFPKFRDNMKPNQNNFKKFQMQAKHILHRLAIFWPNEKFKFFNLIIRMFNIPMNASLVT